MNTLMRIYLLGLFLICALASCQNNQATTANKLAEDSTIDKPYSRFSDSLIKGEENKAIGDIYFGMDEKTVTKLIDQFNKKSEKDPGSHSIGNFGYSAIRPDFYKRKLHLLSINGYYIHWEDYNSRIVEQVKSITDVIKQKFGEPDDEYPIRERYQMEKNNSYVISRWNVGKKTIEISETDNDTYYYINVDIYLPEVSKQIAAEREMKKDSVTKSSNAF